MPQPLSWQAKPGACTRAAHITIAQQLVSTLACLHQFVCVPNPVVAGTAVWSLPDAYQMSAVLEDRNAVEALACLLLLYIMFTRLLWREAVSMSPADVEKE